MNQATLSDANIVTKATKKKKKQSGESQACIEIREANIIHKWINKWENTCKKTWKAEPSKKWPNTGRDR